MPRFVRGLVLAGAFVLAGCSLGGEDSRPVAEQPEISRAQLAAMVPPAEALGASIEGLERDEDSGVIGNADAADDSIDPDDTARSLKGAGRVSGYDLEYVHPRLISARGGKGTLDVRTAVELFEDPVFATQYLQARLGDYLRFRKAVPGVRLSAYSEFEAVAIGDEAGGRRVKTTFPGVLTGYVTDVVFRRGRIVATVEVVRADRSDARQEALRLAVELDRRIQAVLAGEIAPTKPSRREKSSRLTAAQRRKLPAQTLAPEDLGTGVTAAGEGAFADPDYAGYQRTFEDVVVGGSHLIRLQARTLLYEDPEAARVAYRIMGRAGGREAFVGGVVRAFAKETGVAPTHIRARALPNPGRDRTGIVVTFELVGARFEMVSVFMRSGRLVQSVTGICRPHALDPGDLKGVADLAQRRLVA
jgi:hypothetical protein